MSAVDIVCHSFKHIFLVLFQAPIHPKVIGNNIIVAKVRSDAIIQIIQLFNSPPLFNLSKLRGKNNSGQRGCL